VNGQAVNGQAVNVPPMRIGKKFLLFLSYQRYSALIVGTTAIVLWLVAPWLWEATGGLFAPLKWGIRGLLALLLIPIRFAIEIAFKWPRKLRATVIAFARIDAGRFSEKSIQKYCEDPCFRVVAHQILRKAGYTREARSETILRFKKLGQEPLFVMTISPDATEPVRVDGVLFSSNSSSITIPKEQL